MNLINKYVWLVDTIYRAGRITFEGINQKWVDQDMDDKPIPLRTFHKWKIGDGANSICQSEQNAST